LQFWASALLKETTKKASKRAVERKYKTKEVEETTILIYLN
jgi:hypothetical protein